MARRRAPNKGRATLVWAAWEAAQLDRWRRRLDPGHVTPSPATVAALAELVDDERTFVLALADGTHRGPGSVAEIITNKFGPAAPPDLPDAVPLSVVEDE